MEKPYLNQKELTILLGQGRTCGKKFMERLQGIAKEKNYYIPETKRKILIPTFLVKQELKIKEIVLDVEKVTKKVPKKPRTQEAMGTNINNN
jgi:hypothetical protein